MTGKPLIHQNRRLQFVWWMAPENWGIRANPAYTLRSKEPLSRVPIYRWRVQFGPLEVRRWNRELTPSERHEGWTDAA